MHESLPKKDHPLNGSEVEFSQSRCHHLNSGIRLVSLLGTHHGSSWHNCHNLSGLKSFLFFCAPDEVNGQRRIKADCACLQLLFANVGHDDSAVTLCSSQSNRLLRRIPAQALANVVFDVDSLNVTRQKAACARQGPKVSWINLKFSSVIEKDLRRRCLRRHFHYVHVYSFFAMEDYYYKSSTRFLVLTSHVTGRNQLP